MKMVIGLTGGIASGKSTVVDFLISEGYQVIDADKVVRQLQEPGGKLYKAIVETYGLDFIADNGQLNREKLGALVFLIQKSARNYQTYKMKLFVQNYMIDVMTY